MIKQQYFGILPYELYENKKIEDIIDYLSEKELCQRIEVHSYSGELTETKNLGELYSRGNLKKTYKSFRFKDGLIRELYDFLLQHYNGGLANYLIVDSEIYNITFGMNYEEKRKIALKYFKNFYKLIFPKEPIDYIFDENRNVIPATKFESLRRKKESLINKLANHIELILPYLAEDRKYYNRILFENNEVLKEIFDFENKLKIIIKLNNEYFFEEDEIFTPKPKSKLIYEEYPHEFHSLKQLEFIEQQLGNVANQNHAFVVSLFFSLKKELKLKTPSARIFLEIVNSYFNFNVGEIKLSNKENYEHKERVERINKQWYKFKK